MKTLQHLTAIAIVTIIMGVIYVCIQQVYRSNANDPQLQIATDIKNQLQKGKSLSRFFSDSTDLENSLSVFVETYDASGHPLQSSGFINGNLPQLPKAVLDHANNTGENWISWQPQPDIRLAMGIIKLNASPVAYLAIGRSLKAVEERVSNLRWMILVGWILAIVIVLFNWMMQSYYSQKQITI